MEEPSDIRQDGRNDERAERTRGQTVKVQAAYSAYARWIVYSWRSIYFLAGLGAILTLTYMFGYPLLEGPLQGNDSSYALSIIDWIDRWFPRLPLWYPLQCGGCSSIVTYPIGAHYLVALLHRILGIGIVPLFRLAQLGSIALTALGVYLLVWVKLRNQTMALIAGLAYPLSAAVWPWVTDVGLFGQAFSLVYFAPTLLLFDAYLTEPVGKRPSSWLPARRGVFLVASIAFSAIFLTHGATAVVFAMTILLYAVLLPAHGGSLVQYLVEAARSGFKAFLGVAAGLGLSGFWLAPFQHYSALANREGAGGEFALHQIPYLDLRAVIGLGEPPAKWGMWALSFSSTVLILASVGFLLSVRRRRVVAVWGILAVFFVVFAAMPGISPELVGLFKKIWANTYVRALIPTMVFLPAMAGYAVGECASVILDGFGWVSRSILRSAGIAPAGHALWSLMRSGAFTGLALALAYLAFIFLRHTPVSYPNYPGYGATVGAGYWPFDFDGARVIWARPPEFTLNESSTPAYGETIASIVGSLGLDQHSRFDISPFLGGFVEALPLYTDASIVNAYSYGASLFHAMWGYQQGSFYSDEFGSPHEIEELAKWLGIEYVVLNTDTDPLHKYDDAVWPVVLEPALANYTGMQVRRFSEPTGLATLMKCPTILVIGGYEEGVYEQVFKTFNAGAVDYADALTIEGTHKIDDYTLEELRRFDVVFLHGYGYSNRERAWALMADYVAGGGSLFVDTGWQYWTPDWTMESAPAVLPVQGLTWTSFGVSNDFVAEDPLTGDSSAAVGFGPMVWDGGPWGVSAPYRGLREWAVPLISFEGNAVAAGGEYGQGRVVWSGMNLIGHILTHKSEAEQAYLGRLIQWLLREKSMQELPGPEIEREYPDKIVFRIPGPIDAGTYLFWREAESPDWRAMAIDGGRSIPVPIYRAGPGMMLLQLPETQSPQLTLTMEYGFRVVGWIGVALSLVTLALLVASVVRPELASVAVRRFRPARRSARQQGRIEWLPGLTSPPPSPVADQPDQDLADGSRRPERSSTVASGKSAWLLPNQADQAQDDEVLWQELIEKGNLNQADRGEGEQLIDWWKKSRGEG